MKKIMLIIILFFIYSLTFSQVQNVQNVSPIEHVIVIVKENRSFDHYFGKFPGANGSTTGKLSNGTVIPLKRAANSVSGTLVIGEGAARAAYNNGQMNGFDKYSDTAVAYTQYDSTDLINYWLYAKNYVLCDNFFHPVLGPTFPNKLYLVAGQAGSAVGNPIATGIFDNIYPWGWDAPDRVQVTTYDTISKQYVNVTPHWDFPVMIDKLKAKGFTWREFCPIILNYKHSMFGTIKHIHDSEEYKSTDVTKSSVFDVLQFDDILKNRGLANLTYIHSSIAINLPNTSGSEHPPLGVCEGEDFTVGILNSIMNSTYWDKCAIFILWDDYGGFYDHVAPPQVDYFGYSFRVPCLVISPYVKKGISHQIFEFNSINKFLKSNFNTDGYLTRRDSIANDMMSLFDFNQTKLSKLIRPILGCPRPVTEVEIPEGWQVPKDYKLYQNFPNPFNGSTNIHFQIPENSNVSIKLYDESGREVMTVVDQYLMAGYYPVKVNSNNLASGTYIYRINAGKFRDEKKLVILK